MLKNSSKKTPRTSSTGNRQGNFLAQVFPTKSPEDDNLITLLNPPSMKLAMLQQFPSTPQTKTQYNPLSGILQVLVYIIPYIPSKTKSTQLIPPSFAKSFHFCHAQGEDLRKQFERRQAEAATASSDEPTTLWSRKLETLVPLK